MNQSEKTRKAQVLSVLQQRQGDWVDGPDLANAEVGGSEGLKRLRELRLEGYAIEMRKHPDPRRDIWQYRLPKEPETTTAKLSQPSLKGLEFSQIQICERCLGKKWVIDNIGGTHKRVACPRCNGIGVTRR